MNHHLSQSIYIRSSRVKLGIRISSWSTYSAYECNGYLKLGGIGRLIHELSQYFKSNLSGW